MPSSLLSVQRIFFGLTIFLSAFLLFAIEPLTAKRILPWFGGSAAVWSTCLVFYQTTLLLGYGYAMLIARSLRPRTAVFVHIALLAAALFFLPIGPTEHWRGAAMDHPAWLILIMLSGSIGLPFLVLSATSPLLQHWLAQSGDQSPYRLFALSNLASLLALLGYPLVAEPALDTRTQAAGWSLLFVFFACCCALVAWQSRTARDTPEIKDIERIWVLGTRRIAWFALSTVSSMLLLSITNHIDENVAAVPLLWVVPLALYLLTFVLAFSARRPIQRALWLRLLALALGVLGYSIYNVNAIEALQVSIPILLGGLFLCCMFCHGELYRLRPGPDQLTMFYLIVAAGGAAGAVLVGLVAPVIFDAVYELPVTLAFIAGLALWLTWEESGWPLRTLWAAVTACMIAVIGANVKSFREDALTLNRNFYGSLRVVQSRHAGPEQTRMLFHGTIEHGAQYLLLPRRIHPTTYYGPDSGIGILLRESFTTPKYVGVVGLGTGTVAAYGRLGDHFRFYELNDQVTTVANSLFSYLRESKAKVEIVGGDARLSLDRERAQPPFDVLTLDAFSGDAIPVHLLTAEAMHLYRGRIKPNGVLAINVSNNFLDLAPVVNQLGRSVGWQSVLVRSHEDLDSGLLAADWMLLTNNTDVLNNPSIRTHSQPVALRPDLRLWTDSYNNLLQVLKTPQVR